MKWTGLLSPSERIIGSLGLITSSCSVNFEECVDLRIEPLNAVEEVIKNFERGDISSPNQLLQPPCWQPRQFVCHVNPQAQ